MKIFELNFGSVKEMLTKEQMQTIAGGYVQQYECVPVDGSGPNAYVTIVSGDNCCQAQANCDSNAYSNQYSSYYPDGGEVVGCDCND
jgi:hypothetical protein